MIDFLWDLGTLLTCVAAIIGLLRFTEWAIVKLLGGTKP